jgi:transposase-like protein
MDSDVELAEDASGRRRYWTVEEKRRIVEQTLSSTVSVASCARRHGVNANQVFYWRKLYHANCRCLSGRITPSAQRWQSTARVSQGRPMG